MIIYEDADIAIIHCQTNLNPKQLVITFTPRLGNPISNVSANGGFGQLFLLENNINAYHIISKWNHWYLIPNIKNIFEQHISNENNAEVITYGASMGGGMQH